MPASVLISGMSDFYNDNPASHTKKYVSNTIFPAGGSRETTGAFSTLTRYFSGSPANDSGNPNILNACFSLQISPQTPAVAYNFSPIGAQGIQGLVRCVKLDGAGIPRTFLDLMLTADIEDWTGPDTLGGGGDTQGEIWY